MLRARQSSTVSPMRFARLSVSRMIVAFSSAPVITGMTSPAEPPISMVKLRANSSACFADPIRSKTTTLP